MKVKYNNMKDILLMMRLLNMEIIQVFNPILVIWIDLIKGNGLFKSRIFVPEIVLIIHFKT